MKSQTGLGDFTYNSSTSRLDWVGDTAYGYDFNGNQIERTGSLVGGGYQHIDLNDFEMPGRVTQGEVDERDTFFEYDTEQERVVKREELEDDDERTTVSIGGVYERVTSPVGVEHHY